MRRELLNLIRPQHGADVWKYDVGLIDFSCNLNPLGPPKEIIKIIQKNIDNVVRYPDDACTSLKSTLSDYYNISREHIIVGCGSTELIKAFAETFVKFNDHIIVPFPTYGEYAFYCQFMGGIIDKTPLKEEEGFLLNLELLFDLIDRSIKAVFLCNPNNPTSRFESKSKILELIEECETRNILVFIDEAFIDFLREGRSGSCVPEVQNHDNLFISRSLTKIFSIPGIRVGYGVGGKELVKYMDKTRLSWNVGVLEQFIATELIKNCDSYLKRTIKFVELEKKYLYEQISQIKGFEPIRPDANFIFTKIKQLGINSADLKNIMIDRGFLIRDCTSFGEDFSDYIRIAVKIRDLNNIFLKALKTVSEEKMSDKRSEFDKTEKLIGRT